MNITQRRKIFLGLASFEALVMFRNGLFYTYLSIYLRGQLGMSVTETTLFATFPMLSNVIFQTQVWGRVSDYFQIRKKLIIGGELCAGIGTILIWVAHIIPESNIGKGYAIIIGLSCVEALWSMSNVGRSALLSDLYDEKERGSVMGRFASLQGFGRFIGIGIGGLLYDRFGTRPSGWGFETGIIFFVASGIIFLSILPMLMVPEGGSKHPQKSQLKDQVHSNIKKSSIFKTFLIGMIFIFWGHNSIHVILNNYLDLEQGFNVSAFSLSIILNLESIAAILAGLCVGKICKHFSYGSVLLIGALISLLSLILYAFIHSIEFIYLVSVIRGASTAIIIATAYAFVSSLIPKERRGRSFGLYNATLYLSFGIPGTFITGPIVDYLTKIGWVETTAFRTSFLAAALMIALGILIQYLVIFRMLPKISENEINT